MENIKFDMTEGEFSRVGIVHGPHTLDFKKGDGPWKCEQNVWEKVISPTGYFERVLSDKKADPLPENIDTPIDNVELDELKFNDAIEEVESCGDIEQLVKWLRAEKRKTVIEAIDKRLAEIDAREEK